MAEAIAIFSKREWERDGAEKKDFEKVILELKKEELLAAGKNIIGLHLPSSSCVYRLRMKLLPNREDNPSVHNSRRIEVHAF